MNIDQAIYILRNTAWLGSNDERDETEQAVEMVIDKLLSAEKSQLSEEDATKDATSDLISKNEATTIPVMPKEHREYQTMNLDDAYEQGWFDCQKCIEELPSAEPEIKPISYMECANAMLKMWIDNVLTDGEYNRIMEKLNSKHMADMREGEEE